MKYLSKLGEEEIGLMISLIILYIIMLYTSSFLPPATMPFVSIITLASLFYGMIVVYVLTKYEIKEAKTK